MSNNLVLYIVEIKNVFMVIESFFYSPGIRSSFIHWEEKINKVEEKGIAGFSVVEDIICIFATGVNNINNKY